MDKSNLVFLDTETTGLGTADRLCQVAYKFQGKEMEGLFKSEIQISVEAMSVSHITNRMVADKEAFQGSDFSKNLKTILENDKNILVAHNAMFDAEILRREEIRVKKIIDTYKIAQHLDATGEIPRYNLQYLRYYFDFEIADAPAHNALGDIRVLEVIFDFYFNKMLENLNQEKVIEEMLRISALPVLIKKFSFGKYLGEKVEDVAKRDSGYLKWLLGEKIKAKESGEDESADWIYTLQHYLNSKATLF